MPVITFVGSEMQDETKAALIKGLTETATRITGVPAQFMTVIIDECKDTNIGLGSESLVEFKARLAAEKQRSR